MVELNSAAISIRQLMTLGYIPGGKRRRAGSPPTKGSQACRRPAESAGGLKPVPAIKAAKSEKTRPRRS
jgi:hypothetical protein